MDGTYVGVVDRIVDRRTAVILLEEDDEVLEQLDVDVDELPEPARDGGCVLEVSVEDGAFVEATFRPEATDRRREAAQERFDRLSRPLSERDDEE